MKLRKFLAAATAVTLLLGVAATPEVCSEMKLAITASAASSEIPIDEAHFPDEDFREYHVKYYDNDGNGSLSAKEIAAVTKLHCSGCNIESFKGIEYFTALEYFECTANKLTSLDVSKNTELTYLDCANNRLTSLDVSKNTKLTYLNCGMNDLISLDVRKNTKLTHLECYNNKFKALDVSKNTALEHLKCGQNLLTSLDVSKNTALTELDCLWNGLSKLDLSKNTALTDLNCRDNQLTSLDTSKNTALTYLDCTSNPNITLDLSKNTNLKKLCCNYDKLTKLDVSKNTDLTVLQCSWNSLTELNVNKNTKLEELFCASNELKKIDLSKNTALTYLGCYENKITSLDVSKNTALETLDCCDNQLTKIDLSNNPNIIVAYKKGIDNPYMTGYFAKYYEKIYYLNCDKDTKITIGNSAISAVPIDAAHFPDANFRKYVKEFDTDGNNSFSAIEIAEIINIDCWERPISSVKGIEYFIALRTLQCGNNNLSSLDVSKNTKLKYLGCGYNQITTLDLSKNTALTFLGCSDNRLTTLDLSKNTKLEDLYCQDNKVKELDISNNPNLINIYTNGANIKYLEDYELGKKYEDHYFFWDKAAKIIIKSTLHIPHTWDSGKVTKAATYGATGVKTYTCSVCGAKKTSSIAKKTVKKLTAKTTYTCTTNAVRINWNKLSGVTGYKIFRYDDAKKKWVAVKAIYNPNTTNYKISGLKAGKVYKFRVKAFVKENNKFYFGESCSTISTATRPNTTTVTKANKTSSAVRLFWKKTTCTGYRILRYDPAKKKWVRVTAVGSSATTQYKISGLKKNTTYKFKVQPYVKVGSKVIDGAASAVFTVKTSK